MTRVVAVTGATGFIGRTICRVLHDDGWSVRALVRTPAKADSIADFISTHVTGSLEDVGALRRLVQNTDAVVHCAGAVRGATRKQFDLVNVDGVARIVRLASGEKSPPRFLMLSSLAAREPALSAYAASKRAGEDVLAELGKGMNWIALRPPAVYGPGDTEFLPLFRLMGKGVAPVPGSSDARFSMLYVDDLASAVLHWIDKGGCDQGAYELHDGRVGGYSWEDVIEITSGICGRKIHRISVPPYWLQVPATFNWLAGCLFRYYPMLTPGKLRELAHPDWVCSNDAFTGCAGWSPGVRLEEGLRNTPGWAGFGEYRRSR